jgi:Tol biopolymer transport system component
MIGFTAPQTISMSSQRHRSVRRETILALTAGLASVLSFVSTRGDDGPKPSGGKLVIAVSDSLPGVPAAQFRGLALVDPENGDVKNIPGRDLDCGFLSPDGRFLATVNTGAEFPENVGIWIEDVTGKTPAKRIFDRKGLPTWSGDGKQLVISTPAARGKYETYRVNLDGSEVTKLPIPEPELVIDWSRDGTWLASWNPVRETRETHHLLMHLDGTGSREIVNEDFAAGRFQISPNGREVVYTVMKGDGRKAIDSLWVVKTDGTDRRRLPIEFGAGVMVQPRWSPDGERLAVGLRWNGRPPAGQTDQIMIMKRDGKEPRTIPFPPTWRLRLCDWK